jgi:hypothetical protein
MANRATKFVSAIFVGAMVGFPVSSLAEDVAGAADASAADAGSAGECLTTPNRDSPQGQHWYYRLEQGSNRHCWFLRDQAERASQSTSPRVTSSQSTSSQSILSQSVSPRTPPAAKASRNAQASHSPSNARAELTTRPTGVEASGPAVPRAPVFITTDSAGMDRGAQANAEGTQDASAPPNSSDSPDTMSTTAPSPASSTLTTADGTNPDAGSNPNSMEPPAKASASLQVLFLVILGALASAGLTGSLIHRLARIWRRRHAHLRRRSIWLAVEGARGRSGAGANADNLVRNAQRRTAGVLPGDMTGQIQRLLAQLAKQAQGKSKGRAPAKPRVAAATRARTSSDRRAVRASASRP